MKIELKDKHELYELYVEFLKNAERFWEDHDMSDHEGFRENLKFTLEHPTTRLQLEGYSFITELRFWRDGIGIDIIEEDWDGNVIERHFVTGNHFFKDDIDFKSADRYYWASVICSKIEELVKEKIGEKKYEN